MINLGAVARIDDFMLMRGMDKQHMEEIIKQQLASGFAKKLVEDETFLQTIAKREDAYYPGHGSTLYESRVVLLTPEEAKEYKMLKEFQNQMKNFIR